METITIECADKDLRIAMQNAINFYTHELQDFACGELLESSEKGKYTLK